MIDEWVAQIQRAAGKQTIDWGAIQSAIGLLERRAETKEQQAAVKRLKSAANEHSIQVALIGVQRVFLEGKPGTDGWPRKF